MQTSLSTRIEIKTCGGFFPSPGYQCRPDSFQEKVRVTVFQPIKSDTLIPITLAMVVFLAIIIALAYREHQWHPEVIAVGVSIWAIAALVAVLFVGSLGLGDKIELVGAITAEDQACQMRAVRSMDDLSPVPDCPSTPLSRAFWDIRDLLEDGQ